MGTRHLIAVKVNGEYKIGQYGQWDGYPSGQGIKVLRFLQSTSLSDFKDKVSLLKNISEEKVDELCKKGIPAEYSRDTSAKILSMVMERNDLLPILSVDFAGDGLFCEWAYVIDFDTNTFEVYKGFSEVLPHAGSRFATFNVEQDNRDTKYWVNFLKGWPLDVLPSESDFLAIDSKENVEGFETKESLSLQEVLAGIFPVKV